MANSLDRLSGEEKFEAIYSKLCRAINDYRMEEAIKRGVLLGLSGGADSVMLLHLLLEYRRRNFDFNILSVHVNHGIRESEADRDEIFSLEICKSLGVEAISVKADIPRLSKETGLGLEECAREVRYSVFADIIKSRNDISTVVTAHNADDNAETVLLNILRGSGSRGGAGIPPVRDNVIRPLLYATKAEIIEALNSSEVRFVTDSTNLSSDYRRNYLRNEVLSGLIGRFDEPFSMFARFSKNLREDEDFISSLANEFISSHSVIRNKDLTTLHKALLLRVLSLMCGMSLSESLFEDLASLLMKDNFEYTLSGNKKIKCERGVITILESKSESEGFYYDLHKGINEIEEFSSDIIISESEIPKSSLNVYSFSIQRKISSAIIESGIFIRNKKDGDTIFYGGMTRKLKKLFSDRKLPSYVKERIPVFCDGIGVLWVPGYGSRELPLVDGDGKTLYIALCIKKAEDRERFYSASEYKS